MERKSSSVVTRGQETWTRSSYIALVMLVLLLGTRAAVAQQNAGDKELGIGGQAFFTHSADFTGQAFLQFSAGYFISKKNYFGFEADPTFQFSHQSRGGNSVDVGGFLSGTYRRFIGRETGRIFPFIGAGGGAFLMGGTSGKSGQGLLYSELGLKDYVSQRTSLECAYRFNYLPSGSGGFASQTLSQFVISIRHIF